MRNAYRGVMAFPAVLAACQPSTGAQTAIRAEVAQIVDELAKATRHALAAVDPAAPELVTLKKDTTSVSTISGCLGMELTVAEAMAHAP